MLPQLCYLDTNIFLNVIYNEASFVNASTFLLESIQSGKLRAITSSITETEIILDLARTGNRDKSADALRLIERMENLMICPLSSYVARLAAKFVLDQNLALHDAYHGATAIENRAAVFVTRDEALKNKLRKNIKVVAPEVILNRTHSTAGN